MARDNVIELRGIVRNTKDAATKDGECEEVINMRYKHGSWRPVGQLRDVSGFEALSGEGYERLFVHTNEYRHLLGVKEGNLYWIGEIDDESVVTPFKAVSGTTQPIYTTAQLVREGVTTDMRICQTGHLMVVIDGGLSYYMFREHKNVYDNVVTDYNTQIDYRLLPYGNVEFKVEAETDENGRLFVFTDRIEDSGITAAWGDAAQEAEVVNDVIDKTEKSITKLNRFWGAFMVVTACELYDGSFILMSQPQLMLAPNVRTKEKYNGQSIRLITGNTWTGRVADSPNTDYCEEVRSSSSTPDISTSDTISDIRRGVHSAYLQLKSWSFYSARFGFSNSGNKVYYGVDYSKMNTAFDAYANDDWRMFSGSQGLNMEGSVLGPDTAAKNVKEEVPFYGVGDKEDGDTRCFHYANKLRYKICSIIPSEYKDVVSNISVFITPQAQMMQTKENVTSTTYYKGSVMDDEHIREYKYSYRPIADIEKELMGEAMFYKIGEIKTEDFSEGHLGEWIDLEIEEGVLTNLLSQDRLTVDSVGRDSYDAKVAFSYNNRLHIADYVTEKFHGWLVDHFFYNEGEGQYAESSVSVQGQSGGKCGWIKVTIDDDGQDIVVVRDILARAQTGSTATAPVKTLKCLNPMLSYPDRRAKEMEIFIKDAGATSGNTAYHQTFTLKAHDHFNIAYYIDPGWKPISLALNVAESWQNAPAEEYNTEAHHNMMKVSKTDNPIYFPYETVYAVGNGRILGLASNELVLATGQVGDAPLYVFCSDGVYGLFVDSSGQLAYNFARVISEYVCSNAAGIFNIHGGVMFPTEKGYVMLEGLQASDVTDKIEGEPYAISEIPQIALCSNHAQLVRLSGRVSVEDFVEYIKGCIGGYNFADKEIWLCNKAKGYSYVLGNDGYWAKRTDVGVQLVNDFPRTYMLDTTTVEEVTTSTLKSLLDEVKDPRQTMILTRAIKADTQEFKQTQRMVVRGEFKLPEQAFEVRKIDMTEMGAAANATKVEMVGPKSITTLTEGASASVNKIAPEYLWNECIVVSDFESISAGKVCGADGTTELDLLDFGVEGSTDYGLFDDIKSLFTVGYVINPSQGWQSFRPTDTNEVQYSIANTTDTSTYPSGYEVRLKFTSGRIYKFEDSGTSYALYFCNGWEGTQEELKNIVSNPGTYKPKDVALRDWVTGSTSAHNYGLYGFDSASGYAGDSIDLSAIDKTNYRLRYLYWDNTASKTIIVSRDYFCTRSSGTMTTTENCYTFMQSRVLVTSLVDFDVLRYNNTVTVANGNNLMYLDEARTSQVTFSYSGTAYTAEYADVYGTYTQGGFSAATASSGVYMVMRNSYYYLVPLSQQLSPKYVYYTGRTGSVQWSVLWALAAVTVYGGTSTVSLTNGVIYDIHIGYKSGSTWYEKSGVYKMEGTSGTYTLQNIYTHIKNREDSLAEGSSVVWDGFFDVPTAAELLSGVMITLVAGEYVAATFMHEGEETTKYIYISASEVVSGTAFVQKIEDGEYEGWGTIPTPKAGAYLFGSYDKRKWAFLGGREMEGEFRDLGLVAFRTDCKYFRLLFVGTLCDGSSIEYIEQEVKDKMFTQKIR